MSARGNTTVPMSRPSITTPPPRAIFRRERTKYVRTSGTVANRLAASPTSGVRNFDETSCPFTNRLGWPRR
jgi:hypothetical protein